MSSISGNPSLSSGFVAVGGLAGLAAFAYLFNCSSGNVSRTKMHESKQDGRILRKKLDEDSVGPSKVRDQDILDMENVERVLNRINALHTDIVHVKNPQKGQSKDSHKNAIDLKNAIGVMSEILSGDNAESELGLTNLSKVLEEVQAVSVQTHKAAIKLVESVDTINDEVARILGKNKSAFPNCEGAVDEDANISATIQRLKRSKVTFNDEGRENKEDFSSSAGKLHSFIPATVCEAPALTKAAGESLVEMGKRLIDRETLSEIIQPETIPEKVCGEVRSEVSVPQASMPQASVPQASVSQASATVEPSADDLSNDSGFLDEEVNIEVHSKDSTPQVSTPIYEVFWPVIFFILGIFACISVYVIVLPSQIHLTRSPRVYVPPVWAQEDYLKFANSM